MDLLESYKIEFMVHSMKIGNSSQSKSIVELQIKCENMSAVQEALAEIYDVCEEFDVQVNNQDFKGHFEGFDFKDGYDSS